MQCGGFTDAPAFDSDTLVPCSLRCLQPVRPFLVAAQRVLGGILSGRRDRFDQLYREPRRVCRAVRDGSDQQDDRKLSRRACLCRDFVVHVGAAGTRAAEKNRTAGGGRGCEGEV